MTSELNTEHIEIESADESTTLPAYLARPADSGDHPGVLVGFEMFGLTDYVRRITDRIAALGYTAIAPDFYHRAGRKIDLPANEEGRQRGLRLVADLTRADTLHDLEATIAHLRGPLGVGGKLGMVGLSFGGHIAYLAATRFPLAATAVYYGGWLTGTGTGIGLSQPTPTLDLTPGITGRLLFLAGDSDHAVPVDQLRTIEARLRDAGVRHEMVIYPDTPHGFCADERDTYRPKIAEDAWTRTADLFAEELTAR